MKRNIRVCAFTALAAALLTASAHAQTAKPVTPPQPVTPPDGVRVFTPAQLDAMGRQVAREFGALKVPIRSVGILLYEGYTTLDAMGPYQVLSELPNVQVFFVAKQRGLVHNMVGMGVQVDTTIAQVKRLDVLVIPGGFGGTYLAAQDTSITNWVRAIDATSTYTTSVCTGAWILGGAGLLRGKDATTHWYGKQLLEERYGAHYLPERWVRSGKIWTAAGVTAGLDMSLALVKEVAGERYAQAAALDLEYAPRSPVAGGTERTTDPAIVAWMRAMYDNGLAGVRAKGDER